MAIINASLQSGAILLTINTGTAQVTVANTSNQTALFNAFQSDGLTVRFTYTQGPNSTATIAIPSKDINNQTINWVVGSVTTKGGGSVQTVTSPPWQLTMQ